MNKLLRIKEVTKRVGLSRAYIYRLIKEGKFPKQVTIVEGSNSIAFVESEIQKWIDARIDARDLKEVA